MTTDEAAAPAAEGALFQAGTYTAKATGMHEMEVEVTVSDTVPPGLPVFITAPATKNVALFVNGAFCYG